MPLDDSTFYQVLPVVDHPVLAYRGARPRSPRVRSAAASSAAARAQRARLSGCVLAVSQPLGEHRMERQRAGRLHAPEPAAGEPGLRWNLLNGFDRELTIVQREADLDLAEATASDAHRAVQAELITGWRSWTRPGRGSRSQGPASLRPGRTCEWSKSAIDSASRPSSTC